MEQKYIWIGISFMDIIYNKIFLEHTIQYHPENAGRLEAFKDLKETEVENGEKYLGLIHTKEYIEFVASWLKKMEQYAMKLNII